MGVFDGIELDDVELHGERVVLRRWRADDAGEVVEIMRDRSMYEFLALPDPYDLAAADAFVTRFGHEGRGDATGLGCAVVDRSSGQLVGSAALRLAKGGEIGYWVRRSARGRGFATEAVRLLASWAFEHGMPRVWLECDVLNLGSVRVAQRAGFRFEGVALGLLPGADDPRNAPPFLDLARFGRLASDSGDPIAPAFAAPPADGLSDGVVRLRPVTPDDAAALVAADDSLAAHWSFGGPGSTLEGERHRTKAVGLNWLVGSQALFAITEVETGAFAGDIMLRRNGPPQIGGVGYTVHPGFRGRGYTTRALRLLAAWAFEHAGFARLELGAKSGNIASQRSAAAAGFAPDGIREGRLRNADGSFDDEVRFCLLNPAIVRRSDSAPPASAAR